MSNEPEESELFGWVIHSYSRADALRDGSLIDASEVGAEAGYICPVAVTRTVWERAVAWPADDEVAIQDEAGRLWDLVFMSLLAGRGAKVNEVAFEVAAIPRGGTQPELMTFYTHIGPGDDPRPVITIMAREDR